tara:strand:- start:1077 stop:1322 length:246 start_codon:yes stop_codon:yes gene_type:complete
MNLEVELYEGELKSLREKVVLYNKIFLHSFAADKGDIYFVCGEGGQKDNNNLPDRIHICPAYGVDWFQIYERTNKTFGPEY